ncbi:MAG TPA: aldo/keto reductase [Dongiaceae bacterium]|nr:aldo/keto reductase [Dongiaceae bacterium]
MSRICLGCLTYDVPGTGRHAWTLGEDTSTPILRHAIEIGINFFDTANVYSKGTSEEVLGRAIKQYARRDEVVIGTKLFSPMRSGPNAEGLSRKAIMAELDASLKRLDTDYIDLYQIHRWDYNTPVEETLETLNDMIKSGKVRYLGASTMFAWQLMKALAVADARGWNRFVSMQNHINLMYREEEREMMGLCAAEGVGVIPWSPLARGVLTRPWSAEQTKRSASDQFTRTLYDKTKDIDRPVVERLAAVASKRGVPMAQVALAWLWQKPAMVAPVIGATKISHLDDAVAALSVKLSPEEVAALEEPYVPHKVIGF